MGARLHRQQGITASSGNAEQPSKFAFSSISATTYRKLVARARKNARARARAHTHTHTHTHTHALEPPAAQRTTWQLRQCKVGGTVPSRRSLPSEVLLQVSGAQRFSAEKVSGAFFQGFSSLLLSLPTLFFSSSLSLLSLHRRGL